jgi:hypothetical protein
MVIFADMGGPFPCVMVFAFVVIAVVAIVMAIMKGRARREAMAGLAAELGLTYYRDDPWDIPERYSQFDLFQEGHSQKASNVLAGRADGRAVIACDYQYSTGSGKDETTHYCQAAILELPILAARLSLRRETVLDRVASWVGYDDINFESAEFSRRYYVKCEEPKFAYDIFHARLIEYLLACGDAPAMEMKGPLLVLSETQGEAENLRRLLAIGRQIITSIPEYVLTARGIQGKAGGGR